MSNIPGLFHLPNIVILVIVHSLAFMPEEAYQLLTLVSYLGLYSHERQGMALPTVVWEGNV